MIFLYIYLVSALLCACNLVFNKKMNANVKWKSRGMVSDSEFEKNIVKAKRIIILVPALNTLYAVTFLIKLLRTT